MNGCLWVPIKPHLQRVSQPTFVWQLFSGCDCAVKLQLMSLWKSWHWVPIQRPPCWPCGTTYLSQGWVRAGRSLDPWDLGAADWTTDLECFPHDLVNQERNNLAYDNPLPFWGFLPAQLKLIPIHKWSQAHSTYFVESAFFRPFTNQNDV